MSSSDPIDWSAQPLGQCSDAELGRRLGVTREAVRQARQRRGVSVYVAPEPVWHRELGQRSDTDIARDHGLAVPRVYQTRYRLGIERFPSTRIDWSRVALGDKPDHEVAADLGCLVADVSRARRRHGIPQRFAENAHAGSGISLNIDWDQQPLGEMSDRDIARSLGCSAPSVLGARRKRGIAVFRG